MQTWFWYLLFDNYYKSVINAPVENNTIISSHHRAFPIFLMNTYLQSNGVDVFTKNQTTVLTLMTDKNKNKK